MSLTAERSGPMANHQTSKPPPEIEEEDVDYAALQDYDCEEGDVMILDDTSAPALNNDLTEVIPGLFLRGGSAPVEQSENIPEIVVTTPNGKGETTRSKPITPPETTKKSLYLDLPQDTEMEQPSGVSDEAPAAQKDQPTTTLNRDAPVLPLQTAQHEKSPTIERGRLNPPTEEPEAPVAQPPQPTKPVHNYSESQAPCNPDFLNKAPTLIRRVHCQNCGISMSRFVTPYTVKYHLQTCKNAHQPIDNPLHCINCGLHLEDPSHPSNCKPTTDTTFKVDTEPLPPYLPRGPPDQLFRDFSGEVYWRLMTLGLPSWNKDDRDAAGMVWPMNCRFTNCQVGDLRKWVDDIVHGKGYKPGDVIRKLHQHLDEHLEHRDHTVLGCGFKGWAGDSRPKCEEDLSGMNAEERQQHLFAHYPHYKTAWRDWHRAHQTAVLGRAAGVAKPRQGTRDSVLLEESDYDKATLDWWVRQGKAWKKSSGRYFSTKPLRDSRVGADGYPGSTPSGIRKHNTQRFRPINRDGMFKDSPFYERSTPESQGGQSAFKKGYSPFGDSGYYGSSPPPLVGTKEGLLKVIYNDYDPNEERDTINTYNDTDRKDHLPGAKGGPEKVIYNDYVDLGFGSMGQVPSPPTSYARSDLEKGGRTKPIFFEKHSAKDAFEGANTEKPSVKSHEDKPWNPFNRPEWAKNTADYMFKFGEEVGAPDGAPGGYTGWLQRTAGLMKAGKMFQPDNGRSGGRQNRQPEWFRGPEAEHEKKARLARDAKLEQLKAKAYDWEHSDAKFKQPVRPQGPDYNGRQAKLNAYKRAILFPKLGPPNAAPWLDQFPDQFPQPPAKVVPAFHPPTLPTIFPSAPEINPNWRLVGPLLRKVEGMVTKHRFEAFKQVIRELKAEETRGNWGKVRDCVELMYQVVGYDGEVMDALDEVFGEGRWGRERKKETERGGVGYERGGAHGTTEKGGESGTPHGGPYTRPRLETHGRHAENPASTQPETLTADDVEKLKDFHEEVSIYLDGTDIPWKVLRFLQEGGYDYVGEFAQMQAILEAAGNPNILAYFHRLFPEAPLYERPDGSHVGKRTRTEDLYWKDEQAYLEEHGDYRNWPTHSWQWKDTYNGSRSSKGNEPQQRPKSAQEYPTIKDLKLRFATDMKSYFGDARYRAWLRVVDRFPYFGRMSESEKKKWHSELRNILENETIYLREFYAIWGFTNSESATRTTMIREKAEREDLRAQGFLPAKDPVLPPNIEGLVTLFTIARAKLHPYEYAKLWNFVVDPNSFTGQIKDGYKIELHKFITRQLDDEEQIAWYQSVHDIDGRGIGPEEALRRLGRWGEFVPEKYKDEIPRNDADHARERPNEILDPEPRPELDDGILDDETADLDGGHSGLGNDSEHLDDGEEESWEGIEDESEDGAFGDEGEGGDVEMRGGGWDEGQELSLRLCRH